MSGTSRGLTPHQRYEELWRELELCDALGFDYAFCVEHHFRPDESWMSSPSSVRGGRRSARLSALRDRPDGLHRAASITYRCGWPRKSRWLTRCSAAAWNSGLVPGINPDYFKPFGVDYGHRKTPTLEFIDYLRAAYGDTQPFRFRGDNFHTESAELAVQPVQKPHPPLWMMSPRSADA